MTAPVNESAPGRCITTGQGAQDPTASKAGPMKIFAHLPARFRYWHFSHSLRPCRCDAVQEIQAIWAKLDEHDSGLDALDCGVIENGLTASRADARADAVFGEMRALTDEMRADRFAADPLPSYEISRDELEAATPIPPGSNESLSRELDITDEEMLAGLATELWEDDEYLAIIAEYESQRGGAS